MNHGESVLDHTILKTKNPDVLYLFIKRVFDVVLSLIGCLFLIPITIIIKIANMLTKDFGPVFLIQDRIGKDGRIFRFYKYRSMVLHADEILMEMLKEDNELTREYKKTKKMKNDPRVSKVGKVIRKLSIDELPQLVNILKGDMSFIGNRPYMPREKEDMKEYYSEIVKTKPGLTGYWQVNGRSDTTFEERLKLESFYSNHCCFKMDIKIFFKTFKVVLGKKGAK